MSLNLHKVGGRPSFLSGAESTLRQVFGEKYPFLMQEVKTLAVSKKVDVDWLLIFLRSEALPTDGQSWPGSWFKLARVQTFFEKLDVLYWEAAASVHWVEVMAVLNTWNNLRALGPAKLIRVLKSKVSVRLPLMYTGGKQFRDLVVLAYFIKRDKLGLEELIRRAIDRCHYKYASLTPKLVWSWNKWQPTPAPGKKVLKDKSIMLEVG